MSRTLFHPVSLEDLAGRTSMIVIAARNGEPRIESIPTVMPPGRKHDEAPGLPIPEKVDLTLHHFEIRETLTQDSPDGTTFEVVEPEDLNRLAWAQIMAERLVSKSFIRERYRSSLGSSLDDVGSEAVILFLAREDRGLTLEADAAFEAASFREAVLGWIPEDHRKGRSPLPP